ncbi:MAG: hypothetical protein R3F04_15630 [Lysobacteraceae bacterium]
MSACSVGRRGRCLLWMVALGVAPGVWLPAQAESSEAVQERQGPVSASWKLTHLPVETDPPETASAGFRK